MIDRVIQRAPLVLITGLYLSGILVNTCIQVNHYVWFGLGLCLLLCNGLFFKRKISLWLTAILIIALGGLNHSRSIYFGPNHLTRFVSEEADSLRSLVESAEMNPDNRQRIVLNRVQVKRNTWQACRGKLLLTVKNSQRRYFYGDTLYFNSRLMLPSGRRNPGEFDYRKYLNIHHVFALAYVEEKEVKVSPSASYSLRRLANQVKYRIQDLIDESVQGEPGAILKALLIGVRSEISDQTEQAFIDSGVIHVLAVSGLHVAYVTMVFWVIFGFMRLPLKPKVIMTVLALGFYVLIVDIRPSVFRAVIMASMVLIAKGWERKVNIYNSIAAAALIQTLIDPLQLYDMGFQLSFIAVFSIVYIYSRLEVLLPEKLHSGAIAQPTLRKVWQLFLVSVSALAGTLPVTIYYFHRIPIISLLSNLIVIPLVGVIGALGFAQIILGFIWNGFNLIYGAAETLLIELLRLIIRNIASLPGAYFQAPRTSLFVVLLLYLFLLGIMNSDRRQIRKLTMFGILIVGNIFIWQKILFPQALTATVLDIGQGDAILLQLPSKKVILVDTADRTYRRNYAELVIYPYLVREGIRRIDVMILTHPHNDHIGGAPYLLRNLEIGQIWENGVEARSGIYREIHWLADSLQVPIKIPVAGDIALISKNCRLYFLHPSERFLAEETRNYNNGSLVFQLQFGEIRLLFTGDAEIKAENYLTFWGERLKSQLLKVGHHGSSTSSSQPFLDLIHPEIGVISVGTGNKFGHPSATTVERLTRCGMTVYRTDRHQAVQIRTDGKRLTVINWR
jgi:competence protein ComEC